MSDGGGSNPSDPIRDLTNPRQLFSQRNRHDPSAADPRFRDDHPRMQIGYVADSCSVPAEFVISHRLKNHIGGFRWDDRQQFPFVGDVKRVEPEDLAGGVDLFPDGHSPLVEHDADSRSR